MKKHSYILLLTALAHLYPSINKAEDIGQKNPSTYEFLRKKAASNISSFGSGVSNLISGVSSIPSVIFGTIYSSFSTEEREQLSRQSEMLSKDYESNFNPMIVKISNEELFGRKLTNDEMSFLTNVVYRIELAQANLLNLQKRADSQDKTVFSEEEKEQCEHYLQKKQLSEQDFYLKELDIRYEDRNNIPYDIRNKEYEQISNKLLVNLMHYQTALRREMLSLKGSEARRKELQGIVNNLNFEFHYLRIKHKIERAIYEAHRQSHSIIYIYQKSRDEERAKLNAKYQQIIADGRQELLTFAPMIRDVREPFSHSKRRTRSELASLKEAEEVAHIEEIQGNEK